LALPHAQLDSIGFVDPCRQRLAVPEIHSHSRVARLGSQHPINLFHLLFVQPAGTTGSFSLRQGRPVPAGRSGEPSSRLNEARRPAGEPPPGTSGPARPTEHRAIGGRTATLQTAEFLVASPTLKWHRIS
jgi:hypothetical protein